MSERQEFGQRGHPSKGVFRQVAPEGVDFGGGLRCGLIRAETGRAGLCLAIGPEHLNLYGIVHGGVLATFMDNTMGMAAMLACPGEKVVTAQLNIHYLQSVSGGVLTCQAGLIHRAGRTLTLEGHIYAEDGQRLAWGGASFRKVT
ncbi:PaaI family thioesterase [Paenibacillus aurantiacus]|uniref:Acyl-coenzyme A thioesterase THEM4 n=1 Tax=Paenibacillus aurantiacus TaxID=1936118 RepID=A0ABV5KLN7_9BACL